MKGRSAPEGLGAGGRRRAHGLRVGMRTLFASVALGAWLAAFAALAGSDDPAASPAEAVFAGGCFWCMQTPFETLDGVLGTTVGYAGHGAPDPTYEEVSSGTTGYAEAVRIRFDPDRIDYDALLDVFWRNVDPLTADGQFCDHGPQYRSAIFAQNDDQVRIARASKRALEGSGRFDRPIVTEIVRDAAFFPAEEEHQHYASKNPIRYRFYRYFCGRDARLETLWGDEAVAHDPGPRG
ncbi:MAG: peptide-methionine (S)-S-oxide reductase MsrA [Myxococcota bacterium]